VGDHLAFARVVHQPALRETSPRADKDTVTVTDLDLSQLGDNELGALLTQLMDEEKQLSKRRDALHRRIDFLRAGGGAHSEGSAGLLQSLLGEESYVSKQRQTLQRRIDMLRAEQLRRHATR
jgi:hypothetical protein